MLTDPVAVSSARLLDGLVDEEQRREIESLPRSERLAALASCLSMSEPEAFERLIASTGLSEATELKVDQHACPDLPPRLAADFQLVPIALSDGDVASLDLAVSWPPDEDVVDWLATFTHRRARWHLARPEKVSEMIRQHFGVGAGSLDSPEADRAALDEAQSDGEVDEDAAVVRFVTEVIRQAIDDGATDIHFEPQEGQLRIRYRVDGILMAVPLPENLVRFQDAIISRLKIMARLNISERRLPQDGRIRFKSVDHSLDIRVSTIPTIYAESVSLRLLNLRREAYTMEGIGLEAVDMERIRRVLDAPHGIILVTGPTGSGKSTSLNAFLREINSTDLRIVTVEDPIEYEVPGANQIQVRPEIGLTFADTLRHILRQDPDVIMVGEVRDRDTADIAVRASLTGHLVFSTLHTNDAPGAITRLIDMGIEPFLIASAVELVIAQRLVRRLCPQCRREKPADSVALRDQLSILGLDPALAEGVSILPEAVGCDHCRGTGFRGRTGLFEIFRPTESMHDLIIRRAATRELSHHAEERGMRTLTRSGWDKVRAGETTLEEVLRIISVGEA